MGMLTELSLFSGYGGFSLGLRLAGIQVRTVMYVEWERYPQEILKARIKDGFLDDAPIWGDISTLDGEQFRGLVDLITAGFPCQPHSVAGPKRGADDERNLWPETLRVVSEVGPRYVILENVPGLLSASADGGEPAYGGTVVGELASLGYSVHWRTIGADDVGAPHRRKRWWCIAVLDDPTGCQCRVLDAEDIREDGRDEHPPTDTGGDVANASEPRIRGERGASGRGTGAQDVRQGEWPAGPAWPTPTGADEGLADTEDSNDSSSPSPQGWVSQQPGRGSSDEGLADPNGNAVWDVQQLQGQRGTTSSTPSLAGDADEGGHLDDPQHDGQHGPKDPGGTGLRVHPPRRTKQPEQPAGSGIGATGREELADSRQQQQLLQWRGLRPESEREGGELADSDINAAQRVGRWAQQGKHQRQTGLSGRTISCPIWPPGPSDADGWERVLRERPDLAPAIDKEVESQFRRMDDGRSHRVGELKALGNGVLPAVVAEFLRGIRGIR